MSLGGKGFKVPQSLFSCSPQRPKPKKNKRTKTKKTQSGTEKFWVGRLSNLSLSGLFLVLFVSFFVLGRMASLKVWWIPSGSPSKGFSSFWWFVGLLPCQSGGCKNPTLATLLSVKEKVSLQRLMFRSLVDLRVGKAEGQL